MFAWADKAHANNTHARNQNLNDTDSLDDLMRPIPKMHLPSHGSADASVEIDLRDFSFEK